MAHVDELVVRTLDALKLKGPVSRLLAHAPDWLTRRTAREIRNRTLLVDPVVLQQRFGEAIALLQSAGTAIGDYLEFGVYHGTSLACMHRALLAAGNTTSRLIGFDSFEGLPPIAASDCGGHWKPGEFSSTIEFTRKVLDHEGVDGARVVLVKGYFEETLTDRRRADLGIVRSGIIMVDCDLYQSAVEALRFCEPAIVDRSAIFFDDWYPLANSGQGERKAFDEWLARHPTMEARELFDFPLFGKAFLVTRTTLRTA